MTDPAVTTVNPQVAELSATLLRRLPALADELTDRIMKHVDSYTDGGPVPRPDLYESCRHNLEFMFRRLGEPGPHDMTAPRLTGRRRAEQGSPLAGTQSAFRIGFAFMWESVVTEARRTGILSDATLVDVASDMWTLCEEFTAEMASAYRDALTEQLLQRDQERSALVGALLDGRVFDTGTVWEAADLLALPYQGLFVVVAAEAPGLARQALPNIESRLQARGIGSAWRLLPDEQVGIVSLRDSDTVGSVLGQLEGSARARVGVSPVFDGLEPTPRALHMARIALASGARGTPEIRQFDDAPLPVLVTSSPTTAYRISEQVLGPLLEIVPEEREMLLDTLQTYFEVRGSAAEAGKLLFCHPNTVRHRLKRIEQRTGRSLADPVGSAELYVALEARRRLPDRGDDEAPGRSRRHSERGAGTDSLTTD